MKVYQINERHGRNGWIGAFVLAEEERSWGIQGFVSHIVDHDTQQRAYIRLLYDEIDLVGEATLVPGDSAAPEELGSPGSGKASESRVPDKRSNDDG